MTERGDGLDCVPQGCVFAHLLSNIVYDGVLSIRVPEEASLFGFADDLAVVEEVKKTKRQHRLTYL